LSDVYFFTPYSSFLPDVHLIFGQGTHADKTGIRSKGELKNFT